MADKEPRKRKKRKENQKRDESEENLQQKEKGQTERPSSEERSHDLGHEPSIFAKSVFFILFSLLIVAVGVIFFTLHGVNRGPWDASTEPSTKAGPEEHQELHSVIPDDSSTTFDQLQPPGESDVYIEPSAVQGAAEDDSVGESESIKPSDMHPWAEHIPQDKPEEQNILNQLYEALEEELFQDDSQEEEEEHEDDDDDEDGEEGDFMEDSFFKVDDVQGEDEPELAPQSVDSFEVVVEEVEIPQQSLLDLPSEETFAQADVQASETPTQPLESSMDFEIPADPYSSPPASTDLAETESAELEQEPTIRGDMQSENVADIDAEDVSDIDAEDAADMDEEEEKNIPDERIDSVPDGISSDFLEQAQSKSEQAELSPEVPLSEHVKIDWPEDNGIEKSVHGEQAASSSSSQSEQHVPPNDPAESVNEDEVRLYGVDAAIKQEGISNSREGDDEEEDTPMDYQSAEAEKLDEVRSAGQENVVDDDHAPQAEEFVPYEHSDVTNEYDFLFKEDIDEADRIVEKSPETALKIFEMLATKHPESPRVTNGKARCLDKLAEVLRKNTYLDQAIDTYKLVLQLPSVPEMLYLQAGNRAVNRLRFRGYVGKALKLQSEMAAKYPDNTDIQNQMGVSYLWMGKGQIAKTTFQNVLRTNPKSGFAKVHLGFILKTEESKYEESIALMREGISSREEGVIDGRFFFHLGDALSRIGRPKQAMLVYEEGVREGVFLSAYQRSLYNVDTLTGKPWWRPEDTPYYSHLQNLEKNWVVIRNEALSLMDDRKAGFVPENEGLRDTGDWKQFELFSRGRKISQNCQRAPHTCSLFETIPDASGCKRGQVKFSIMQPGTHVWAHTGPTNCRIRAHLGLVVPEGPRLRVANETRTWAEGKIIMFDDSFEHEVWHDGKSFRLVLIADFWHPELTPDQKATLSPI